MSSSNLQNKQQPGRYRNQITMQDFINRNDEIKYQGYIDNVKSLNNI